MKPSSQKISAISRRTWLKGLALAGASTVASGCWDSRESFQRRRETAAVISRRDLLRQENEKPGTRDWLLHNARAESQSRYRCPWIEGYCSHTSIRAGETLNIFVSTNPKSDFTIDIFRMGFYGGAGGRLMTSLGSFPGKVQRDPEIGKNRLRECRWEPSASIRIPKDWLSGVYVGKLTEEREKLQSYVIFIVRDDRKADFIFQTSDTTWQSYNRWPDQFALYDDGKDNWYCGPGVDVSFDRPYGKYCQILDQPLSIGSGEFFLWEFPLVHWLEAQGCDVTYVSNLDTHAGGAKELLRAKGFLSVGHDEYYSIEMYEHLQAAIARGLNVGFFSGNTCCGRIDPRPNSSGRPNRIFGRVDHFGPRDEGMIQRFPTMGNFPYQSPHEQLLMGARNVPPCTGGADWVCAAPEHWIYDGTRMKKGDAIPGLIGWEFHGDPAPIEGLTVVATAPTQSAPGKPNDGIYTATVHPGPKGNFIFNASTCWWADGLSEPPGYMRPSVYTSPKGPDQRVQKITENILRRMTGRQGE